MKFTSFDGKEIYVHEWLEAEKPKGVVQILHGMAEHAKRYDAFAHYLNANGFIVVADDHRGHGKTDPESLGYAPGNMFADTVKDAAHITDHYKKEYPELPFFLMGFSYGSFLAQSYIAKYGEKLSAAIIAGSSHKKDLEVYLGSFVSGMGCMFSARKPAKLIEKLSFGAYEKKFEDREWLSVDGENNSAYREDTFSGFTCSNRFYSDFFKGLRSLYTKEYIAKLPKDLPILLASGQSDPVGNMGKGVKKLYEFYTDKAGMEDVSMVLFENSRHEFLNEKTGRETKWGTLLEFLQSVQANSQNCV
ncbi:MAG: alpha/beta hydrolase [Clostridia bacterium]|nr:alpha/beta hydrolase [Clostridia bacterium]